MRKTHMYGNKWLYMQILCCCFCRNRSDKIISHMRIFYRFLFGIIRIIMQKCYKLLHLKNWTMSLGLW